MTETIQPTTDDAIERLSREGSTATEGASLLVMLSAALLTKEIVNTALRYGQNLFGERIRVGVASQLSRHAVERILTYRLEFFGQEAVARVVRDSPKLIDPSQPPQNIP